MSVYCAHKFYLNKDSSVVEFHNFNGNEDNIYPTLSLCFNGGGMFNQKLLSKVHLPVEILNTSIKKAKYYEQFLLGNLSTRAYLNISYNNVTPDMTRILENMKLFSADETGDFDIYHYWQGGAHFPFYESLKSPTDKCFSMDIDSKNVPALKIHHLSKIRLAIFNFLNGVFAEYNWGWLNLDIYLSYPNQLMRSYPIFSIKQLENRKYSSTVKVMLHATEVILRRNKYNDICEENWVDDDNQIIQKLVEKVGCHHEFWKADASVPICQSQKEFIGVKLPRLMTIGTSFLDDYPKPCREIQNIISTAEETTLSESEANDWDFPVPFISFEFHFKTGTFKVIQSVRAFDGESLIGNLGGYLGLFLGFSIWQAPEVMFKIMKKAKDIFL